jgi:hypothetical protein
MSKVDVADRPRSRDPASQRRLIVEEADVVDHRARSRGQEPVTLSHSLPLLAKQKMSELC